jgi:mRNA interferase RelE/StbE
MIWRVQLHKLVLSEDLSVFTALEKEAILKAINRKLSLDPEAYGKPLTGEFKGYWRLRVDDCRVIYRIVKDNILVIVVKIGVRKDDQVYHELTGRLKKL